MPKFIRKISFEAQGANRLLVRYEGLEQRGVMYHGQAWFDVVGSDVEPATRDFDRSHSLWIMREGVLGGGTVSQSARAAIAAALLEATREWLAAPANDAAGMLRQAERERLERELADAALECMKLTAALTTAESKRLELAAALNRL